MNILKAISDGNNNVEAIRKQLFNVVMVPLYPPTLTQIQSVNTEFIIPDNASFVRPENFSAYKHIGGKPLGTIGKDFRPTQPSILLDAFSECLIESGLDLRTLKYEELQGGRKVQFSVELTPTIFKNAAKVGDIISNRLVLRTGFDGYTATTFQIETLVLKCTNGMTAKDTSVNVKFKNTQGNLGKIAIACTDIAKMAESAKDFGELIKVYDAKAIDAKILDKFLTATIGYNRKDANELGKIKTQRLDELMGAINVEFKRNGRTAWGLLNGLTYATNHIWAPKENALDYIHLGGGLKTNDKAQKFLNELVLV